MNYCQVSKSLLVATLLLGAIGCSNGSDSAPSAATPQALNENYVAGTADYTMDVTASGIAEGQDMGLITEPALVASVEELAKIDHAVMTTDGHVELYAGSELALVIAGEQEAKSVVWTRSQFSAESITYVASSETAKGSRSSTATFVFTACTEPVKQEQEQVQAQDQDQKEEVQAQGAQDQAPVEPQGKDKVEEKAVEPKAECQSMTYVLALGEREEKQVQEEEKQEEPKAVKEEEKQVQDEKPIQG